MSDYDLSKRAKAEPDGSRYTVFDWSKLDEAVSFFKPVEGEINRFDLVPYKIKTKNHPLVVSNQLGIGDPDYSFEYWVHKNIGPTKKTVLCINRMYGRDCPICDASKAFKEDGDDKSAKACWPSLRVIYNIKTKDGKMQVFDVSDHLFGKAFKAVQATENEDGATFLAADLKKGKTVVFTAKHVKKDNIEFTEFEGMTLKERKVPVTEEDASKSISFDELVTVYTTEQIDALFHGGTVEEEDTPPPEEEKKPVKHEDDVPSCPSGHTFGKDNDKFTECEDCKVWKACIKASK